jgi:hypothetical protein
MAGDLASNRDEILGLVQQCWKDLPALFQGFPQQADLVFTMTDGDGVPEGIKRQAWARVTLRHGAAEPTAVSGRRWRNTGLLRVQCFLWRDKTSDDAKVQAVAAYIVGKLRDHRGSVLFTNASFAEAPINNGFTQCDAVSAFQWEEFRKRS